MTVTPAQSAEEARIADLQHSLSWALNTIKSAPNAADLCPWHGKAPFPHSCPYWYNVEWAKANELLKTEILSEIWIWDPTIGAPAAGKVTTDSHNWISAAILNLHSLAFDGTTASAALSSLKAGDTVSTRLPSDPKRWAEYRVNSSPTLTGQYYACSVTYTAGGGTAPLVGGEQVKVTLLTVEAPA